MSSNTRATKAKNVLMVDVRSPTTVTSPTLLEGIEKKLQEQREFFAALLKSTEEKLMQCISAVSAEMANMRSEFKILSNKQKQIELKCNDLNKTVDRLNLQVSVLENGSVSSDIILLNVPNSINASTAVENSIKTLGCNSLQIERVYRISKNNTPDRSVPIIAKLKSPDERVKFFRSLAQYRKNNRKLKLSDIGFAGDTEIVARECLTNFNKMIFRSALEYKKQKILAAVFSLRGSVYVRATVGSIAVKVVDMTSLIEFVGGLSNN